MKIILLLFFFPFHLLFANPISKLNKTKIKKGEPLYLEIEVLGGPKVSVKEQVARQNGVIAEYIGVEENVSIINGNMTRKKKIKYRIVTPKEGKQETPALSLFVDGKLESVSSVPFEVSSEKYEAPPSLFEEMDDLFHGLRSPFKRRKKVNLSPDDFVVTFHTNRDYVYTGETLVGYYILFYKNSEGFYLERNEFKPPEFPFFFTEMLYDVAIETPAESILDGKTYKVQPYQKEIFALTPLRSGKFTIGNAQFAIIDGGLESILPQKNIDSRPKTIQVRSLPKPAPGNFSGEVGNYSLELLFPSKSIPLGGTIPFTVKIKGEGVGTLIKDPLSKFCPNESCGARFVFLNENRSRKFVKLADGNYGFSTELIFNYSIYPKREGTLRFDNLELVYFNPSSGTYETSSAEFPPLQITEKPMVAETLYKEEFSYVPYLILLTLLFSGGFIAYQFQKELLGFVKSLSSRNWEISLPFVLAIPKEIKKLDEICGHKKDALLKNFLIQKGFSEDLTEKLVLLKERNANQKFAEIFEKMDNQSKQETAKMVKELFLQKEIDL